jgi:DNA-binding NarL/FixJ family response regulator
LHPSVARKVANYFAQRMARRPMEEHEKSAFDRLTKREVEILELAAQGMTNREIASKLTISTRTVQAHMSNVFSKLGVGSRTEAVLYAVRKGRLTLENMS